MHFSCVWHCRQDNPSAAEHQRPARYTRPAQRVCSWLAVCSRPPLASCPLADLWRSACTQQQQARCQRAAACNDLPLARRPVAEAQAVCAYPADTGTLAARHCRMWKEEGCIQAQAQAPRSSVAAGGRYSEGRWDALFTAGHTPADT